MDEQKQDEGPPRSIARFLDQISPGMRDMMAMAGGERGFLRPDRIRPVPGHAPIPDGFLCPGADPVFFRRLSRNYRGGGAVFKLTILERKWLRKRDRYNFTVNVEKVAQEQGWLSNRYVRLEPPKPEGQHIFYTKWNNA